MNHILRDFASQLTMFLERVAEFYFECISISRFPFPLVAGDCMERSPSSSSTSWLHVNITFTFSCRGGKGEFSVLLWEHLLWLLFVPRHTWRKGGGYLQHYKEYTIYTQSLSSSIILWMENRNIYRLQLSVWYGDVIAGSRCVEWFMQVFVAEMKLTFLIFVIV